jgi:hypothetical protein
VSDALLTNALASRALLPHVLTAFSARDIARAADGIACLQVPSCFPSAPLSPEPCLNAQTKTHPNPEPRTPDPDSKQDTSECLRQEEHA